jgi:hypothetical protein
LLDGDVTRRCFTADRENNRMELITMLVAEFYQFGRLSGPAVPGQYDLEVLVGTTE